MPSEMITSQAAAARLVDVTAPTIRTWIAKGHLPGPPWTPAQVTRASDQQQKWGRGSAAEHGTESRWRAGCDCRVCADGRNERAAAARNAKREERWRRIGPPFLDAIASGLRYSEALVEVGVTAQAVTEHRLRNEAFAKRLHEAFLAGRDDSIEHGTASAWRGGCRCTDCREHHDGAHGSPAGRASKIRTP